MKLSGAKPVAKALRKMLVALLTERAANTAISKSQYARVLTRKINTLQRQIDKAEGRE